MSILYLYHEEALKGLHRSLNNLLESFTFIVTPTALWLSLSSVFILATVYIRLSRESKGGDKDNISHAILPEEKPKRSPGYPPIPTSTQALLTLVVPTKVSRSSHYAPILDPLTRLDTCSKTIYLDFAQLVDAICDTADLELRDPSGDLKSLLRGEFTAYGWKIIVRPSLGLSCRVLLWILKSYASEWPWFGYAGSQPPGLSDWRSLRTRDSSVNSYWYSICVLLPAYIEASPINSPRLHGQKSKKQVTFELPSFEVQPKASGAPPLGVLTAMQHCSLRLDETHRSQLPNTIRNFLSTLPRGYKGIIECTTIAPKVALFNHDFVLLALVLCRQPGSLLARSPSNDGYPERTTPTSLCLSLPLVLQMLTDEIRSSNSNFQINAIYDTSHQVAKSLQDQAHTLMENQSARMEYIHKYDISTWRRRRLSLTMEAGMLIAGLCSHWEIHVKRR